MDEKRGPNDRRSGKDRRNNELANYDGIERRSFEHRRILVDRRKTK